MRQKVVYFLKNTQTFLLAGDQDAAQLKMPRGEALPELLEAGWKIVSVYMTASAAVNDDQILGLAVLEKVER